jgi:hypothetical protein
MEEAFAVSRDAGNPPVRFDVAGAGDGVMEALNGQEAGNGGHSQGASCTPPRRSPTRPLQRLQAEQVARAEREAVRIRPHWLHWLQQQAGEKMTVGDEPQSMYMLTSKSDLVDGCCFDYRNAETRSNDLKLLMGRTGSWPRTLRRMAVGSGDGLSSHLP